MLFFVVRMPTDTDHVQEQLEIVQQKLNTLAFVTVFAPLSPKKDKKFIL